MAVKSSTSQPKATWQDVEANDHVISTLCWRFFGADCDDAKQEIRLHVWRKLDQFRGEAKFSTWLHRVAFNQCLVIVRMARTKKRSIETDSLEAMKEDTHFDVPGEEPDALRAAVARDIVAKLDSNPRMHKHVVRLFQKSNGMTYTDMAEQRGLAIGTVKSDVSRSRRLLRKALAAGVTK